MGYTEKLRQKFLNGLLWNGFSYIVYKISFIILSFFLYKIFSTNKFSSWALTNSVVFLLLLWLDCGLRKSIPRFSPLFSKNERLHRYFINGVIIFQAVLLSVIGIPLLLFTLKKALPGYYFYVLWHYAVLLFIIEGMIAIIRLVYQAHFLQKQFGIIYVFGVLIEMIGNFLTFQFCDSSKKILVLLFWNKIFGGFLIITLALLNIRTVYQTKKTTPTIQPTITVLTRAFFFHSIVMWLTTILKSFSERNFLLLFLTWTSGPIVAHLFKLSHDAAIFFQRGIIKTIGSTDTVLLSYAEEDSSSQKNFKKVFKTLIKTVCVLILPLIPVSLFAFIYYKPVGGGNSSIVTIFLLFIAGYTLEILFSPYERVLETKMDYKSLWICYGPYIIILLIGIVLMLFHKISVLFFLSLIQASRIISTFLITLLAHKRYLSK